MKKTILLLLAIVSINTKAQTWSFKSYKNAFDGDIKAAFVEGSSDGFNLLKPVLAINKFVKKSQVNFYLDNVSEVDENDKMEILWAFNNNSNEIFKCLDFSIQKDAIFFRFFSSKNKTYTFYEIIKKLKESSTVSIRVKNKEDSTDYTFSLKGSSNTISKVISSQEISEEIKKSQSRIKERENLNEDELAVFDMLVAGKKISDKEKAEVKDAAKELLERLKKKEFKVDHWAEKIQTTAAVRKVIEDYLYMKLPYPTYDDDVTTKAEILFNDFKERYQNYGREVA